MSCSRSSSRSTSRARLELLEAVLAEGPVGGPVGLVEGPPGGGDGPLHIFRGAIGHLAQQLLGGGIDSCRTCFPLLASTSFPSMSILDSGLTCGVSAKVSLLLVGQHLLAREQRWSMCTCPGSPASGRNYKLFGRTGLAAHPMNSESSVCDYSVSPGRMPWSTIFKSRLRKKEILIIIASRAARRSSQIRCRSWASDVSWRS